MYVCAHCNVKKQPEIKTFEKTKCTVKILNFTTSTSDDIILNH